MSRRRKQRTPQRSDDGNAFLREAEQQTGARDDLAEQLAEDFERSVVDGDGSEEESKEQLLEEQLGGPFLESAPEEEFDYTGERRDGIDDEWEATALPEAVGPLAIASAEEEQAALETQEEATGEAEHPDADDEIPSSVAPDVRGIMAPKQP